MINKWRVSSLLTVLIMLSLATQFTIGVTPISPPGIEPDAPTKIKLYEDSSHYYLDLFDIYDINDTPLNFTVWDGANWGSSFESAILTATINTNDTIVFTPKPNMNGADIIKLNATNLYELSTHYDLTVSITPVNDPPVIEMIGNVKVNDTNFVKFFLYEDDLFNETVIASDIDGDTLVYFDNASIFDINYLTGAITFIPTDDSVGVLYTNITVSDINGSNSEDWIDIEFTILNVNDPPTATIIEPENDTYFSYYEYIYFEGQGDDPDIKYGDFLYFEWYSDIDGYLGSGEFLSWVYLSEGQHQITLNVTDAKGLSDTDTITIFYKGDPYDEYHNIYLSLINDTLLIKQNEKATCQVEVENWGYSEDVVTFDTKKYFDFSGEVEFEIDNLTLEEYGSAIVNVSVSVPADAEIGFYPVDLHAQPDIDYDDDYNKYYWEDEGIDTLRIFVISNQTEDSTKQAQIPNWNVGDNWQYSLDLSDEFTNIEGTMEMEVIKDTTVYHENNNYEAYLLEIDSDIDVEYDFDYEEAGIRFKMYGEQYYRKSDLATIMNTLVTEYTMNYYGETSHYKSEVNSSYDPPATNYKFPLQAGSMWTVDTKIDSVTTTDYDDTYDDYTEQEKTISEDTSSYICLGSKMVTTEAGTFEGYLIAEFYSYSDEIYYDDGYDYEDDPPPRPKEGSGTRQGSGFFDPMNSGDVYINIYSPDVNYTLKELFYSQVYNYDYYEYEDDWTDIYDWDDSVSIELTSYELVIPVEESNETEPDDNSTIDPNDLDDDGLPDDWEDQYNADDPNADIAEFENGTSPVNANDNPDEPIDNDEDGLPDAWEYYYDLDPSDPDDAYSDTDNDGFNNLKEYQDRTSPVDPDDHPEIVEGSDDPTGSEGIFGLGKVGELDLFYLYLLILIIIIILVVLAGVVKHRKRKREYGQPLPDQRVADKPVTPVVPKPAGPAQGGALKQPTIKPSLAQGQPQHPPPVPTVRAPEAASGYGPQPGYVPQPQVQSAPPPPPPPPAYDPQPQPQYQYQSRNRRPPRPYY